MYICILTFILIFLLIFIFILHPRLGTKNSPLTTDVGHFQQPSGRLAQLGAEPITFSCQSQLLSQPTDVFIFRYKWSKSMW